MTYKEEIEARITAEEAEIERIRNGGDYDDIWEHVTGRKQSREEMIAMIQGTLDYLRRRLEEATAAA